MRVNNLGQTIVFKGIILSLVLIMSFSPILPAFAAQPTLSISQLIQGVQGKSITPGQAAPQLSQLTGMNQSSLMTALTGLQQGKIDASALTSLTTQAAGNLIPKDAANALAQLQNLGKLTSATSIADVLKNPAIQNLLKQAGAGQIGNAVSQITKLVANPQTAVTQALAQALAKALPAEVVKALGGLQKAIEAIQKALGITPPKPTDPKKPEEKKPPSANAGCSAICPQCAKCPSDINNNHKRIRAHVSNEFETHRSWIVTTFFMENILPALQLMTSQFVTNMMEQVLIIGSFFDAKHQLETQRLMQQLTAEAHKDYQPSEELCNIGTNVRSLAASERKSNLVQGGLSKRMLDRYILSGDSVSKQGGVSDLESRVHMFIQKFCIKTDHADGLSKVCKNGGKNKEQLNMDVDYTSAVENKLTLKLDFSKEDTEKSIDEENVFALGANLFGNKVLSKELAEYILANKVGPYDTSNLYLDLRSLAAKRSIANNSFAAITALKAEGNKESAPFLKAILATSGINPTDVEERLGKKPSYFAQMEVLTKDIYQNPTFYAGLYDKPVNIERKGAALQAIELMQDRDIYKSLLRSEAILATLVETLIIKEHTRVNAQLFGVDRLSESIGGDASGASDPHEGHEH